MSGGSGPSDDGGESARDGSDDRAEIANGFEGGINQDIEEDGTGPDGGGNGAGLNIEVAHSDGGEKDTEKQAIGRGEPPGDDGPVFGSFHAGVEVEFENHIEGHGSAAE